MTHFKTFSARIAMLVAGGAVALAATEAHAGSRGSVRHAGYHPAPTYARSYATYAPTYYAPRVREVVYTQPVTSTYVYARPAPCEVYRPVYVNPYYSYSRPVVYTSSYNTCRPAPVYYSRPSYGYGVSFGGYYGGGSIYYRR